jgi:hypothetical protein
MKNQSIRFAEWTALNVKVFPDGWHYKGEVYSSNDLYDLFVTIHGGDKEEKETGKHNPKNKEEAYCHQFEHDLKLCFSMSQMIHRKDDYESKKRFQDALSILKTHISSYEQTRYT